MAAEIGVNKTARAMRLDYTALEKRVVVLKTPDQGRAFCIAFIDALCPVSDMNAI